MSLLDRPRLRSSDRADEDSNTEIANALWPVMCRQLLLDPPGPGPRGIWRRTVHYPLMRGHYRRVWQHEDPEPYLTLRRLAGYLTGDGFTRYERRYEPLEWGIDHEGGYRSICRGMFQKPFIVVFGYPRSGTTSLQNLVLRAFRSRVIPGDWSDDSPLRIWWHPKHDSSAATKLGLLSPEVVQPVITVRTFEDAAASIWVARGQLSRSELMDELDAWMRMADAASLPNVVSIKFDELISSPPHVIAAVLANRIGIPVDVKMETIDGYEDLYDSGTPGLIRGDGSNLPDPARNSATSRARKAVAAFLGPRLRDVARNRYESLRGIY